MLRNMIPEGIPFLTNANDYSANQYKSKIRSVLGDTQVDLFDLIETIISLYGINIVEGEKSYGGIIICDKLNKYINESTLNNILHLVLECNPDDVYKFISSDHLTEKYKFYYDNVKGRGVLEKK